MSKAHSLSGVRSTPNSRKTRRQYIALNGLRGVSTLIITLFHVPFAWSLSGAILFDHAFHLVDFFFVLSGFVMTHGFEARIGRTLSYRDFVLDRLARIYPVHVLFLVLFLGYEMAKLIAAGHGVDLVKPPFTDNNAYSFNFQTKTPCITIIT